MNLVDRLLGLPERQPDDRAALVSGEETLTYGALRARVARWRGGLAEAGVGHGDRVVLVADNSPTFVIGHLAVVGAGAAVVPLNPASPPAELARELQAVGASAAIVAPRAGRSWVELQTANSPPPTLPLDRLEQAAPVPVAAVEGDTPAALLYTSGTAGMPKPAVLTHGNLEASLLAVESLLIDLTSTPHVVLAVIPLFHVFGFNAVVNLGLAVGATIVLDDYTTPERVEELVAGHGVTILAGPPTLWRSLADRPGVTPDRYATVTLALSGAAKLPPRCRLEVRDRLGLDLDEGYGLTETCAMVASSVGTDAPIGSVGRLVPGVEGRIVDERGADVLVGDPGELWVRGPMVSSGYAGRGPDGDSSTAGSAIEPGENHGSDGWLHTGDVAVVDDDGYLAIVDRLKEVVNVSGFNVFPAEVEAALTRHPDIDAAAVIGEPSEATGETLVAYVVPRTGAIIDDDRLTEHCRSELARYKVPHRFEVRETMPVGVIGKLRRRELR
ncbi:MAG: AMP-binding protein [Acidimicrobiia bacterium]|nr:AMP-binding protein [Acidimicrobiia bacterium]